jgi:threonine 3-dehydrogenase
VHHKSRPQESSPRSVEASVVTQSIYSTPLDLPAEPVPQTMRALVKTAGEPGCDLVEVPVPTPGPDEVLVRVQAGGICGTDLHIYRWDPWARSRVRPPRVIGHEFCGTVVSLGPGVTEVALGERVAGESHVACGWCHRCRAGEAHICERLEIIGIDRDGAFADYVAMPARNAWRLDEDILRDTAAVMDPLGNAVHTALATEIAARTVAITGCGPIGLMAIPVVRMAGAAMVIATDVQAARLSIARRLGADLVLDAGRGDAAQQIKDATGGRGVDVVLEMSGHPAGIRDALHGVRSGGWVGLLGLPAAPVEIDLASEVIFKAVRFEGIVGRRLWQTWDQMTALLRRGLDITPVITHRLPLEEFTTAFELLESGEAGKVVLSVES